MVTIWPVSARWLESLARSGEVLVKVEVLHDGDIVETLPRSDGMAMPVGGGVQVERRQVRRSGSLNVYDVSGNSLPQDYRDLFVPLRGEFRPYVGLRYWDATPAETAAGTDVEYVPTGTLVIQDVDGEYPHYTITGLDRRSLLNRLPAPYGVASGTNLTTAVQSFLIAHMPAARLEMALPASEHTTGAQSWEELAEGNDVLDQLALAAGWMLYVDPMGVFTAVGEPSTDDDPVMTYEPGQFSMLMRPKRRVSAADAVNAVITKGEAADTTTVPPRGYVEDNDPSSITYAKAVGIRPFEHVSPLYRTTQQAQLGAQTIFLREVGIADSIIAPIIPNPALESGDVLQVRDPDQGIDLRVIADGFGVPLRVSGGEMSIACRSRVIR